MIFIFNLLGKQVSKITPQNMSVGDHIEDLRWHLIRSCIVVLVFTILGFIYMPVLFNQIILAPAKSDFWTYRFLCGLNNSFCIDKIDMVLQSRTMAGQFTTHIYSSFVIGVICSFPYLAFELWSFIKPALYPGELKISLKILVAMPVLFISGLLFGYYVIAPLSINFLANYKLDPSIANNFDLSSYISTLCMLVLGSGMMFQLPILVYFLVLIGILKSEIMSVYRKYAIIGIFVVAAILTPSPDMLSQVLVAVPLYFLYEISILVAVYVESKTKF